MKLVILAALMVAASAATPSGMEVAMKLGDALKDLVSFSLNIQRESVDQMLEVVEANKPNEDVILNCWKSTLQEFEKSDNAIIAELKVCLII